MPLTLGPALAAPLFQLQTPVSDAVAHPAWRQTRGEALAALGRGESVAVLGRPGTGKTLLLQSLAQDLASKRWKVHTIGRTEPLTADIDGDVLLVDEVDQLATQVLAALCATNKPLILTASPSFALRLAELPQRITPVTLEPLSPEEVARFVVARLSASGRSRDLLEPDAVLALAQHSAGLLRLVILLGSAALFLAEQEDETHITRRHVEEAVSIMREIIGDQTAPVTSAPQISVITSEPVLRRPTPPDPTPSEAALPLWRTRHVRLVSTAVGLILVVSWAVSGWRPQAPPLRRMDAPAEPAVSANPPSSLAERTPPPSVPQTSPVLNTDAVTKPQPELAPEPQPGAAETVITFRGPVMNKTMNQGGLMSLVIRQHGSSGAITARFNAWAGLIGSGDLSGTISADGQITASGQLMMGRNPFNCTLNGRVTGNRLTGSATFVRNSGSWSAHSTFALTRS